MEKRDPAIGRRKVICGWLLELVGGKVLIVIGLRVSWAFPNAGGMGRAIGPKTRSN